MTNTSSQAKPSKRQPFGVLRELAAKLDLALEATETAREAYEEAVVTFNLVTAEAQAELMAKAKEHAEAIAAAKAIADETAGELRSEFDEKSERWQEGEKGQAVESFVDQWESYADTLESPGLPDFDELVLDLTCADDARPSNEPDL